MGRRNYLIAGVSCSGKTSVCSELPRRGHHAVNGDTDLAYQGDPTTGIAMTSTGRRASHWHHIWNVNAVRALAGDCIRPATFFCGGSRNLAEFVDLFDAVFVLRIDLVTLRRRLDQRPDSEFGGIRHERDLIVRIHQGDDAVPPDPVPADAIDIDATVPIGDVVDEILRQLGESAPKVLMRRRPPPP